MIVRKLAGAAIGAALVMGSAAAEEAVDTPVAQVSIGLPAEAGRWQTRSQPVYDPHRQELQRRRYTVWNATPSRDLDFAWVPDRASAAPEGHADGEGRLVWRLAGKPAYDPASFVAEYRGTMRQGRPHGRGIWRERDGLVYEGGWRLGRPHGAGRLRLPSGAEYAGAFAQGLAHGSGHFYDVDGEVFEGGFARGLRQGGGRTVLPNGAAYLSRWAAGDEVASSRAIRLAQLGPGQGGGQGGEVRLGVSVDRSDDQTALQYTGSNQESGLVIQPARRLVGLWKGNEDIALTEREENPGERGSYGVFAYSKGDLPPLSLVFEVQNRTPAPVRIRGGFLDVETSVSDLQPAIQLTSGSSGECSARPRTDFSPTFELENFGWAPAERAQLRFSFQKPKTSPAPGAASLTKDVGLIRAGAKVDLEAELRGAGVRTAELKRRAESGGGGIPCRAKGNAPACLAEIAGSGLFGSLSRQISLEERDIFLNAVGTLSYSWKDQKGQDAMRTSPFTSRILLGRTPIEAECGEGAEKDPIARRPLEFRLDQSRYRLPVAFERTIPNGRSARYTVVVQAPKASEHKFKVVLQTADGQQIVSRPISLLYFRPSRLVAGNSTE